MTNTEIRKTQYIIGVNNENSIVIVNIELKNYFSVTFDIVAPFELSADVYDNYKEMYLEIFDEEQRQEIEDNWYYKSVEEFIDISLYPNFFTYEEFQESIYFYSVGCGQCDERNNLKYEYNQKLNKDIFKLWDTLHLQDYKNLTINQIESINSLFDNIGNFNLNDEMEILTLKLLTDKLEIKEVN